MSEHSDVVVIGSGASGDTVVHRLAQSAVNPALTTIANGLRGGDRLFESLSVSNGG